MTGVTPFRAIHYYNTNFQATFVSWFHFIVNFLMKYSNDMITMSCVCVFPNSAFLSQPLQSWKTTIKFEYISCVISTDSKVGTNSFPHTCRHMPLFPSTWESLSHCLECALVLKPVLINRKW